MRPVIDSSSDRQHKGASPHTTAVIVTYRSRNVIDPALQSLRDAQQRGELICTVVDNNSDDGTAEHIEGAHPWVRVIRNNKNLGFARACNIAFAHVTTPFVLLLNPDSMLRPGALSELVSHMKSHRSAGIVGPAIIKDASDLQQAGRMLTPMGLMRAARGMPDAYPESRAIIPGDAPFRTTWVCGAVMLIRASLLRDLGGFDDRFFLYFEETDLCRRAATRGAEIWAVGTAVARHCEGKSAEASNLPMTCGCVAEHYFRSRFYFLVKHFGWSRAVLAEGFSYALHIARLLRTRVCRRPLPREADGALRRPLFRFPAQVAATCHQLDVPNTSCLNRTESITLCGGTKR